MLAPIFLLFLGMVFKLGLAANVLIMHPASSPSHVHGLRKIAAALVQKGHHVTTVLPNCCGEGPPGVEEIVVKIDNRNGTIQMMTHDYPSKFLLPNTMFWEGKYQARLFLEGYFAVSAYCRHLFPLRGELARRNFTVAVVDLILNECGHALVNSLGIPTIGYSAMPMASGESMHTTYFNPPSTTPMLLSGLPSKMNLSQRIYNTFILGVHHLAWKATFFVLDQVVQEHIPESPSTNDLLLNLSGMLINTNPILSSPILLPPTFLEIGGYHIQQATNALPSKIQNFITATNSYGKPRGTIVFSLGMTFNSEFVPKEVISSYLSAFALFPQYRIVMVIAKGGAPLGLHIPSNVLTASRIPQADLLAHPDTKLFITHCGLQGVYEALFHGVPIVGIPLFADQKDNAMRLQERDLAIIIERTVGTNKMASAINQVLHTDSKYRKQAAHYATLLADRPIGPKERAIWLIEHVSRTGGANHLKMESRHMSLFVYLGLDVLIVLILAILMSVIMLRSIKRGLQLIFSVPNPLARIRLKQA